MRPPAKQHFSGCLERSPRRWAATASRKIRQNWSAPSLGSVRARSRPTAAKQATPSRWSLPRERNANASVTFSLMISLFVDVTGRQDLMRIHPHHEIDNLGGRDLGECVRRVRRDDDHIARSDLA